MCCCRHTVRGGDRGRFARCGRRRARFRQCLRLVCRFGGVRRGSRDRGGRRCLFLARGSAVLWSRASRRRARRGGRRCRGGRRFWRRRSLGGWICCRSGRGRRGSGGRGAFRGGSSGCFLCRRRCLPERWLGVWSVSEWRNNISGGARDGFTRSGACRAAAS